MSTAEQRFSEIARTYQDAINNYYSDMASSKDETEAKAIDRHYHEAEHAYNMALEKALIGNSPAIEANLENLKKANDQVDKLRSEVATFAKILEIAGQAVDLAKNLVLVAG